jgi:hypothetical protein
MPAVHNPFAIIEIECETRPEFVSGVSSQPSSPKRIYVSLNCMTPPGKANAKMAHKLSAECHQSYAKEYPFAEQEVEQNPLNRKVANCSQ